MIETIKALFAYFIATTVILGGMIFLYKALFLPIESRDQLIIGAIIALISAATSFVFGSEISTRSARQSERASKAGIDALNTPPPAVLGTSSSIPLDGK